MPFKHVVLAGSFAATVVLGGGLVPAFAVSGGGGGSSATPIVCRAGWEYDATQQICVPCAQGAVYDEDTKKCVAQDARLIDDKQRFEQGRALALAGKYSRALVFFDAIEDKSDADVLTMIGYATRKLGDFEQGIAYYQQALAIDPDNLDTHEYLGEAYVSLGRDDLAGVQLDRIEAICGGTDCEHYVTLEKFMAGDGTWN